MIRNSLAIAAAATFLPGCVGFYRYHETAVTVVDPQTGEGIAAVPLKTVYSCDLPGIVNMPREERATTDEQGHATISIASWGSNQLLVGDHTFWVDPRELKTGAELSWRAEGERPIKVTISPEHR
jgi:hypothetical protein